MRGDRAAVRTEKTGESGVGESNSIADRCSVVSSSGLSVETGPAGLRHSFGLHVETYYGKLIRVEVTQGGREPHPCVLSFVIPHSGSLDHFAEPWGFEQCCVTATAPHHLHSVSLSDPVWVCPHSPGLREPAEASSCC